MSGNAVIKGNTAKHGGGVYVYGGTFTKKASAVIYGDTDAIYGNGYNTDNTATSGNGHAVYLTSGKKRNSTAPAGVNLYAQYRSTWTYVDPETNEYTGPNWE
jgi:hypothetical protein